MKRSLFPTICAALLLAACFNSDPIVSPPGENPPAENPDENKAAALSGVTWVLVSVERPGEAPIAVDGDDYTIRFDSAGYLSGQVNCNAFGGAYTATDSAVKGNGEIWTTAVGCEDPYGGDLLGSFGEEPSVYEVQNDTLCITSKGHKTCFVAAPAVPADAPPQPINPGIVCDPSDNCLFSDAIDSSLMGPDKGTAWLSHLSDSPGTRRLRVVSVRKELLRDSSFILNLFPDIKPRVHVRSMPFHSATSQSYTWSGFVRGTTDHVSLNVHKENELFYGETYIGNHTYYITRVGNGLVLITERESPVPFDDFGPGCSSVALPKHAATAAAYLTCVGVLP